MAHIQTESEWQEEMSAKIVEFVRHELYMELRYLKLALSQLQLKSDPDLRAFATDGAYLYVAPEWLIGIFEKNAQYLGRAYLHTVLHCIFSHLWIGGNRDRETWHLACDIAVEYTIDWMQAECTKRILSWTRKQMYDRLKEQKQQKQGISAAVIYRMIENEELEQKILLQKEFYTDDHCYWPKKEDGQAKQEQAVRNQNQWNKIARQTKMEQEMRGGETADGEDLFLAQATAEKSRRSYKDFLQRFSVLREEIGVNQEEFDLNYYTYGLKLYGNMPLMEPLESREVKKIREFVIAIDTSYSTSGALVEQFLKETFSVLTQKNSFFAQSKIRVIQCDNQVRSDVELRSERDIAALMQKFTVAGGGSTDFRPVFSYVNDLIERGELKNIGGLLYFTDGRGTYPKMRPDYQTAFLFLEDYDDAAVPPWAIRLKLEPEEFAGTP